MSSSNGSGSSISAKKPRRSSGAHLRHDRKDKFTMMRQEFQEGEVQFIVRELAQWLTVVLGRPVSSDFQHELASGKVLCDLAGIVLSKPLSGVHSLAEPGSFQARENVTIFLRAAHDAGIDSSCSFTADDIQHGKLVSVVSVLLGLARIGAHAGIQAPPSVQADMEREAAAAAAAEADDAAANVAATSPGSAPSAEPARADLGVAADHSTSADAADAANAANAANAADVADAAGDSGSLSPQPTSTAAPAGDTRAASATSHPASPSSTGMHHRSDTAPSYEQSSAGAMSRTGTREELLPRPPRQRRNRCNCCVL